MPEIRNYRSNATRSRGSMLIIAIGVLTLLAVLGTTFVQLMKLERQATRNYLDAQVIDLVNDSALDSVIAQLRGAANHLSYTNVRSPWLYEVNDKGDRFLAHGRVDITHPAVGEWSVLQDDTKRLFRYKTKVIDCAAQLNINGQQDSLARMLENLADAITRSRWLNKGQQNPLYSGPRQTGEKLRGRDIIAFRNKLEGHRFRSKSQLAELIGQENYQTIKDFVTVHSWEDPYTCAPDGGLVEIDTQQNLAQRAVGGGNPSQLREDVHQASPAVHLEPRSPININTAPEEVLTACLMGLGGRRAFPFARLNYDQIDSGATILGQRVIGQEEFDMLPRGVWVYLPQLEYDHAFKIAQEIVRQRKLPSTQFRTWSSGQASLPGFAEFVNRLDPSFFPSPSLVRVVDPANPNDRQVAGEILGGSELGNMWRRGHDNRENSFRREAGLPYHTQFAFYYDMAKSVLRANFNPNTRSNRINPNVGAYVPTDKSDLVILDKQDGRTTRKGYTTEFCFDAMGVFEITTLGDLAQHSTNPDGVPKSLYSRKVRSVVKVYDVLRHTSQFHFAQTFTNKFGLSSRANRRDVITWPDPLEALTEVVSQGSTIDGRVELAGQKDGMRLRLTPGARQQLYQSPESILCAMGFQDRDDQSFGQLRRLVRAGATGTREFQERLEDIYNANYSRLSPLNRKRYTRAELQQLGGIGSEAALNQDPALSSLIEGNSSTDLRPDGIHTSLLTSTYYGGRFVLLPSHNRIGSGSGKSGRGTQVGAGHRQNVSGNIPYYNGGLAFWVKFDFDGLDPVFSGLIGATSVVEAVGQSLPKDSEGTQFYIFKNTKGQLRVVRMYYHQAFPPSSGGDDGGGGGGGEGGLVLWPPIETDDEPGGGGDPGGDGPPVDIDPRKPIARADVIVDIKHFKAHEWHHIAVDWNDENPSTAIEVWIDFEKVSGARPFIAQDEIEDVPTAWVRLNCRDPRDSLFVGGFIRDQGVRDAGVFKWFSNTIAGGATGGGGLQMVAPSVKKILANATIDEFVTYTGNFQGVRQYFVPRGAPGYFSHRPGEYANLMEVPMPPGVNHVMLRSFDWTSYIPTYFTGNDRQPRKVVVQPITCQISMNSSRLPPRFRDPWRDLRVANKIGGFKAGRAKGARPGSNADLVYRFSIPPAKAQSGSLAGGSVHTPVIDDVTLTYYLPDPKILHQEEEEVLQ